MLFLLLQSPRNGEDLSDGEAEVEAGSHDEAMGAIPRESSPEDGLGGGGQVRVKVTYSKGRKRDEDQEHNIYLNKRPKQTSS